MKSHCEAIFLFIAELTGSFVPGSGTIKDKTVCGQNDYITNFTHTLDLTTEEGQKDVHENIWIERLYKDLDAYFSIEGIRSLRALSLAAEAYRNETYKWSVPIELDSSASMLQYIGILLNDKRLMSMTNVIGDTLEDPWKLEGISRKKLKCVMTPKLYGSSQSSKELWTDNKMAYENKDVELVAEELKTGAFGLANSFKDFIINNCKPKSVMKINIGKDEFDIRCNKFRNVGDKIKAYKIWDSVNQTYDIILHTDTHKVADLEQFRRFQVTLLIHNLDSQVMDNIMVKVMDKHGWAIPIHDAAIVSPAAASDIRTWYNEELLYIYNNRKDILNKFFKSIGVSACSADAWQKVANKVVPFKGNLEEEFSMPLK